MVERSENHRDRPPTECAPDGARENWSGDSRASSGAQPLAGAGPVVSPPAKFHAALQAAPPKRRIPRDQAPARSRPCPRSSASTAWPGLAASIFNRAAPKRSFADIGMTKQELGHEKIISMQPSGLPSRQGCSQHRAMLGGGIPLFASDIELWAKDTNDLKFEVRYTYGAFWSNNEPANK